jgi:hypothetical protein
MSLEHQHTLQNKETVQEVSKCKGKNATCRHGKTDVRYWERSVFQPTYTSGGQTKKVGEWAAKIQHAGRRETFALGTSNRAAAANIAKAIYLSLQSAGWEATASKFKPHADRATKTVVTVGDFLQEVKAKAGGRPKTIEGYCKSFRGILADILEIDGGTAKYDYRTGRAQEMAGESGGGASLRCQPRFDSEVEAPVSAPSGQRPVEA